MYAPVLAALLAAAVPTDTTLDNGLRVVLIPHRSNPMVASAVVVGAGVVHEPPGAGGSSHFLEHLLFNGTTTRTQKELYDAVDRIGAYNNATTREDHTLFTLLVASRHAEAGLAIQADMLFRSTIPPEVFEKERKIVLEELARDRSDPGYAAREAARGAVYAGTPIARPVLGTPESLASISRESVVAYYKARYVPGNMVLVVMGDFETETMLAAIGRTFGTARKGKAAPRVSGAWPAVPEANLETASSAAKRAEVTAAFPWDAEPWDGVSLAAELLLAAAGEGEDSPLARALSARGIDGNPRLALERRGRPWSTVVFEVPASASPAAALDALAEAIRSTGPAGAARTRLPRALARARADEALARDQIHYFALLRSDRILGAPRGALAKEAEMLRSLHTADFDAAAARLQGGLAQIRAHVAGPGLEAGRAAWSPPAATPAKAIADPLRSGELSNGLRYVVRRSDDSEVVAMHVAFSPRSAAEPSGLDGITDAVHRAMLRATLVHPAPSLAERRDTVGARVRAVDDPSVPFDDYYTTPEFSWIRLEAPVDSWREAILLVGEMVRFPELTDEAAAQARAEMAPLAERRAASPREVAVARLDALLAPGHPLIRPPGGRADTAAGLTAEALRERHRTLATGRGVVVSLVGPVDPAEAVDALRAAFGGMPAGEPPPAPPPVPRTERGASDTLALGAPQGFVAWGAVLDVPVEDRAALTVAVAALSERRAFDLRETRGLAYSIGASLRRWGDAWRFDVAMGTRPDNLEQAEAGIRDVLAAFRSSPPDDTEVARVVAAVRGRALMRRMTRISLAYEAGLERLRGQSAGDERRALDALSDVRADRVRDAFLRRIDPERLARVVVR